MSVVSPSTGDAPEVEDGLYTLRILRHEDAVRSNDDEYDPGAPIVKVYVALEDTDDGEGNEIILRPIMNRKWSAGGKYPASTLYLYAKAFGVAGDPKEAFDTDWLDGARARGMVKTETVGGWPKIEAKSLLPMVKRGAQSAPRKAQEAAPASLPGEDASLAAQADANALASFWEAAETEADRGTVSEMADTMFGKTVSKLTTSERDSLLEELRRGA